MKRKHRLHSHPVVRHTRFYIVAVLVLQMGLAMMLAAAHAAESGKGMKVTHPDEVHIPDEDCQRRVPHFGSPRYMLVTF